MVLPRSCFLCLKVNLQQSFSTVVFSFDHCLDSVIVLAEFCQNFEEETSRLEPNLDPVNSPVNDEVAMNVFRLESRVAAVVDYLARLKVATSRIDSTLWPGETLQNDLESLMARLNTVPGRVQEWKKSSARCGADVALCLARVHCKDARRQAGGPPGGQHQETRLQVLYGNFHCCCHSDR